MLYESFSALDALSDIRAVFTCRVPGLDVSTEREEALRRLRLTHGQILEDAGFGGMPLATAEQVHGNLVATVSKATSFPVSGADGLLTTASGLCLGIYVADCAAVYLVDRKARGVALVHSGRKGTELGIAAIAARELCEATGAQPSDLIAQISPCIRPPHYEVDFAAEVVRQLGTFGITDVHDCQTCTACHPDTYYSYRREMGKTGRMLALLALMPKSDRNGPE
ncbi:MAG: polyphenol oxidase family protein [Chthoniobacterales bacterium]|nr:polyphenol oxidase family protein [Chthoniobacterales bacterium]